MPAMTNFPYGVSSFGVPLIGSGPLLATGKFFFVSSGNTGADGNYRGTDADHPLATIQFAIGLCVANRGDVIILMPGHAESITAAGSLAMNKAGVRVIGIGRGANRPTLTFSTVVGATIAMSANSCSFENVIFDYTGIDAITTGINVTASDCAIQNCKFIMSNSTNQATNGITLGSGANNFFALDNEVLANNAGADTWLTSAVTIANVTLQRNRISGDFAVAAVNNATNAWARCVITHNLFYILGTGKAIILVSTASGMIGWNMTQITANIAAGGSMTAAAALKVENYAQETAGIAASAVLDPAGVAIT